MPRLSVPLTDEQHKAIKAKARQTGGAGFLGSYLVSLLEAAGASVFVPRSADYDLRDKQDVIRMLDAAGGVGATDILFHLAATVGGIGANRQYPADFYCFNTLMNTLV